MLHLDGPNRLWLTIPGLIDWIVTILRDDDELGGFK